MIAPTVESGHGDGGDDASLGSQFFTLVGREVRVGRSWQIDSATCEVKSAPAIVIGKQPANGRLDVRPAEFALPKGSVACKGKPARGVEIYYVPNAGFSGQDHLSYRVTLTTRSVDHDVSVTVK